MEGTKGEVMLQENDRGVEREILQECWVLNQAQSKKLEITDGRSDQIGHSKE